MAEDTDVTSGDSSSPEAMQQNAENAAVTGDQAGRTIDNVYGEFNRKFGKLQNTLDTVMTYIAQQQQVQRPVVEQAPAQGQQGQRTMEQLYQAAAGGDRQAYDEYHSRLAAQQYAQQSQQDRKAQLVTGQLQNLVAKYPQLRDSSHPLTVASHRQYQTLIQAGYPANQDTLLEAAKSAIADSPEIVSEIYSQPAQQREQVRQSATQRAQSGVMGASHRAAPASDKPAQMRVSPQEADLARRMGIKEPGKSKERFLKRQEAGQSSLGSVAAFVNDQEF